MFEKGCCIFVFIGGCRYFLVKGFNCNGRFSGMVWFSGDEVDCCIVEGYGIE